jgi:hypothetical protein
MPHSPTIHVSAFTHLILNSCALTATITVEAAIKTVPTAGWSRMPAHASAPAASGIATML